MRFLVEHNNLLPRNKDGQPDHRFIDSLERVVQEVGDDTLQELCEFREAIARLQQGAANAGLRLALEIFHEAEYLDRHHRFDADNPYGYKSKVLRGQAQQILENLGFKKSNAGKLVAVADFLSSQHHSKEERQWFNSLTISHLYEISRMSDAAFRYVKEEVRYDDFHFSAGQRDISVRRLEDIRRQYPKRLPEAAIASVCANDQSEEQHTSLTIPIDTSTGLLGSKIEQFTTLLGQISWDDVSAQQDLLAMLSTWSETLEGIAQMVHQHDRLVTTR